MKKEFNKLVRDKIPEIIEENGEYSLTKTLNDKEYEKALYDKLLEEANEVINANKKEETDQTILDEKISNAAHMYIAKYYSDKVVDGTCNSSTCRFTLNDLEQDGLINLKGKNCTNVMAKDMLYLSSDNPNIKDSYNFDAIKPPNASDCASYKIGK